MTFISIIIPFKKGKRYLKDCLDSLTHQNLENEEIIIIVNGNDELGIDELIREYYDKLNIIVKTFFNELGVAKARNEGLKIAKGEYIYFIDSDDYIYKNALSKLIDVAKNNHYDFINGERVNTYFILDRFNEELLDNPPLKQCGLDDYEFSFKLLVGNRTNNQEVLSVLHALIKKDVIKNTCFDEHNRYFSDYKFIIDIIDNINSFYGVEDAVYGKRNSDDPINLISLTQEEKEDSFLMYCNEFNKVINRISQFNSSNNRKYNLLKTQLYEKFSKLYFSMFSTNFIRNPDNNWRTIYLDKLSEISKDFNLDNFNFKEKQEIKALQDKNTKKLKLFIQSRLLFDKLKQIKNNHWLIKDIIYMKFFNKKNIKENKIFIESFRGDFYSDSPKYIYQYLYEHYGDKFEYVWVMNKNVKIPGNPKTVKRFSLEYYKQAAISKYWLINTRQSATRLQKRHNQILISTWHGTPLKRLGFDQGNLYLNNPKSKFSYMKDSAQWDYLISPNKFTTEKLRSSFAYDGEVLQFGYPRNDILYNANEEFVNNIKYDLNIPLDKKVIFYAPTWRDDESFDDGKVKFELKLDLDNLKESLSDEYIILIRTHYFIANTLDLSNFKDFTFDVSEYDDIAELYLISDILITDYSSVFFDYANLKRPILFYTYDLDKYENMLRGFYIDIRSEVPGPLLYSTQEIIDAVKNIDSISNEYKEKYNLFYERFCSIDDGNASKRVVEEIWSVKNK